MKGLGFRVKGLGFRVQGSARTGPLCSLVRGPADVSKSPASTGHLWPPPLASCVTVYLRCRVPPPHLWLHSDNGPYDPPHKARGIRPISVYRLGQMPMRSCGQSVNPPRGKAGFRLNAHTVLRAKRQRSAREVINRNRPVDAHARH